MVHCVVAMFCLLISLSSAASSPKPIELLNGQSYSSLTPYLQYGFEPREPLSLNQVEGNVQWQNVTGEHINLGFGKEPIWIKLTSVPQQANNDHWWLYLPYHALNKINYYVVTDGQVTTQLTAGWDYPFTSRNNDHRYYVFPLPGTTDATVYLRVEATGAMYVPLQIWPRDAIADHREKIHFLHGIYVGVIGAMIIYNLFLFFAIRESLYVVYIAYIFSYLTLLMANEGFAFQYLWPNYPDFNMSASPFFACITGIIALEFSIRFLNTRQFTQIYHALLRVAQIVCVVLACLALFVGNDLNFFVNSLSVLFTFLIVVTSIQTYRQGGSQAAYFMLAWVFLLTGIFVFAGAMNGLLPMNTLTRHSLQIGSIAEVLMFSFALANRINVVKEEKNVVMNMQSETLQGLKQAEMEIYDLAFKDRLTGLANREKLSRHVNKLLVQQQGEASVYLVIVHLKQLQEINKGLGYKVGDDLLVRIALLLRTECEAWLNMAGGGLHFDGDKDIGVVDGANFAIVLCADSEGSTERFCQRILALFDRPIDYADMSIDVGASIGYSASHNKVTDFDGLLKNAQVAVEAALEKSLGYACYSEDMDPYSEKRITLLADLKAAIANDDLALYLQPKLSLHDNIVIGFEALLRWNHPRHGFIPPDEFIVLAEKSGVINELTEWVIAQALVYLQFFRENDLFPHISINVSAKNLQQPFFADQLMQSLKRKNIEADALCLEITETAMMDDPDRALSTLHYLKQQGIQLSLDDFGTGYSSLSYLSRMPIHEIKIDRSFTRNIEKQETPVVVETTLRMAKSLALVSVAEGIENEQALKRIRALGCDVAQGYYIAKPQPFDTVIKWLAQQPGYEVLRSNTAVTKGSKIEPTGL